MATGLGLALDILLDLQRAMERTQTAPWSSLATSGRGAFPSVNLFSEDDDVVLVAELPGVAKGDVDVQIRRNEVRIFGNKNIDYGSDASLHRRERLAGRFDRIFTVPFEVETDGVEAHHRQGLLAIRLPRAAADRPRAIEVQ